MHSMMSAECVLLTCILRVSLVCAMLYNGCVCGERWGGWLCVFVVWGGSGW